MIITHEKLKQECAASYKMGYKIGYRDGLMKREKDLNKQDIDDAEHLPHCPNE